MTNKDKIYIAVIAFLLVFAFLREGCNQRNQDKVLSEILNYKSEAKHYKDKYGIDVATNKALNIQTQEQIKSLLATNDTLKKWVKSFKNISAGIVVKETTIVKEVNVPYEVKIPCDFKPFKVRKNDKNYLFAGTISPQSFTIDSIMIPNEARIIVGEKKTGILGLNKEYSIDIRNSNELLKVSDISAYTYKPQKKWYEKAWFHYAVGVGSGVILTSYINKR